MSTGICIICGGQSGVDMAAADAAIMNGIDYTGYVPKGRMNENGAIPSEYNGFCESFSNIYSERTYRNVLKSNALLIIINKSLDKGTRLTHFYANLYSKPVFVIDVNNFEVSVNNPVFQQLKIFVSEHKKINIAGSRESNAPGIYKKAFLVLDLLFKKMV